MMKAHLTGLMAAPYTPMGEDGSIRPDRIQDLARFLQDGGVSGAFVCGTTGEGVSLTVSERMEVAERWLTVAGDEFPIIVHVGGLCLRDCKALGAHAQKNGASAIAAMAPCFFRPSRAEDLVPFCAEIAAAAPDVPFYYYHIPTLTGAYICVLDFLKEGEKRIPTLSGVKFSHRDLTDYARCLAFRDGKFDMLFGCDEILLMALVLGARGAIGTTYNYAAPLYLPIIEAHKNMDLATARREQARAMEMSQILEKYGGLSAGKAVMKMIGMDCGPPRLPLLRLTDEQCQKLRAELDNIGFFTFCTGHRAA